MLLPADRVLPVTSKRINSNCIMKECCKVGDQPKKKRSINYMRTAVIAVLVGIILFAIIEQL